MATLQDLVINKKQILGIDVHALTLEDIAYLLKEHREAVKSLFSDQDLEKILVEFPSFIAGVIAKSTKSDIKVASQVPAGKQLELLVGVWEVSQINVDLLGKVLKGITGSLETVNKASKTGK